MQGALAAGTRARLNGTNEATFAAGTSPPDGNGHLPGKAVMPGVAESFFSQKAAKAEMGAARRRGGG